jgi:hypothetical protein
MRTAQVTDDRVILAPKGSEMDRYAARICWNTEGWVVPSGDAPKLERGSGTDKTWVTRTGYGHEEWLFNFQWVLDGWKYGYMRPVQKSWSGMEGQKIDVRLYTIGAKQSWFYVGRIAPCHVLTDDEALEATTEFRRRGWLRQMKDQARAVGGDALKLNEPIFCIKFKPADAEILDPMEPVGRKDAIRRVRRYSLVTLEGKLRQAVAQWPTRSGTRAKGRVGVVRRSAVKATSMDLAHKQLQHDLYLLLARRYGKSAVIKEDDFADIKVKQDGEITVIEVKTDPRPMRAVREALGQLLEYAFVCASKGQKVGRLLVAAPGELDDRDRLYVEHLRSERGLPLDYLCFRQGMKDVTLGNWRGRRLLPKLGHRPQRS